MDFKIKAHRFESSLPENPNTSSISNPSDAPAMQDSVKELELTMDKVVDAVELLLQASKASTAQNEVIFQQPITPSRFLQVLHEVALQVRILYKKFSGQSPTIDRVREMLDLTLKHFEWLCRDLNTTHEGSSFLNHAPSEALNKTTEAFEKFTSVASELCQSLPETFEIRKDMIASAKAFKTAIADLQKLVEEGTL